MTMGRYMCPQCNTIVNYGEKHPCFFYNNDDPVYTIPQQEYAEEMSTSKRHAENSNDDHHRNICETAEQTRNTSPALTSPALSVFSIENKDMLSRDLTDRPSSPVTPIDAPNRRGEMDANEKQPLEWKKDAGAEAGPSTVHPHSLGPGRKRKYVCNVCRKQFKQKSNLVNHYRIHTGEKPFVCDTCGKDFAEKGNLTRHVRTHTVERPFVCDTCGREFTEKGHLNKHIRIHTGKMRYVCDTCGKDFTQKVNLNTHLKLHTGEKPFACDTCGRQFSQKGNLTRHLKTHTDERPFLCDICGRSFADGSDFKKHAATHNGGKRYTCSVCRETFGSNEDRNRHFQEKHQ